MVTTKTTRPLWQTEHWRQREMDRQTDGRTDGRTFKRIVNDDTDSCHRLSSSWVRPEWLACLLRTYRASVENHWWAARVGQPHSSATRLLSSLSSWQQDAHRTKAAVNLARIFFRSAGLQVRAARTPDALAVNTVIVLLTDAPGAAGSINRLRQLRRLQDHTSASSESYGTPGWTKRLVTDASMDVFDAS